MYDYPDYDDFYSEPSEYEQMVYEFKESLKKSVSQEWVDRMNKLEKENAELQDVKRNFEQIKRDYESKERALQGECDRVKRDAEYKARYLRLKELMKDLQVVFWTPTWSSMYPPKCGKCEDGRVIRYKSPTGKNCEEVCSCANPVQTYEPKAYELYEISLRNRSGNEVSTWLTPCSGDDDDYYKNTIYLERDKIIKDDVDFETLRGVENIYKLFFESYERCEKFCKWYTKEVKGIDTTKYITKEEFAKENVKRERRRK